ncbi:hypothetical protein JHN59_37015 [Streptomyces sp. MBT49]|uniref:hypothetical protein n=1 Tax=unclassified Streptomyces TaxID=2593676 RepID=UPI00190A4B42|nr:MULTISPECIES: hypothetical protein [unclassified Streptomyces]MBK3630302.1 hypothetical protein [Streptomyces sp. MBT49]MBK3634689.1 hypothetical protein [Streptomyces sp. MBT97]
MNLPLVDPTTGLRRGAIRHPNGTPPQVLGCRWCGEFHVGATAWVASAGLHEWTAPTETQVEARRAARGIAYEPAPAGQAGCEAMTHNALGSERHCANEDPLHLDDHDDGCGDTWPVESWER